jgi:uncharacterized protein YjeT (DUF2065 family)
VNALVTLVAGPVGWGVLLVVIGFLVAHEVTAERRGVTGLRGSRRDTLRVVGAVAVALGVVALRFYGFS